MDLQVSQVTLHRKLLPVISAELLGKVLPLGCDVDQGDRVLQELFVAQSFLCLNRQARAPTCSCHTSRQTMYIYIYIYIYIDIYIYLRVNTCSVVSCNRYLNPYQNTCHFWGKRRTSTIQVEATSLAERTRSALQKANFSSMCRYQTLASPFTAVDKFVQVSNPRLRESP